MAAPAGELELPALETPVVCAEPVKKPAGEPAGEPAREPAGARSFLPWVERRVPDFEGDKQSPVGTGAYVVVQSGTIVGTKKRVVLKISTSETGGLPGDMVREVAIMQCLNHPNILRAIDWKEVSTTKAAIMLPKFASNLYYYHRSINKLPLKHIKMIAYQILCGLEFAHAMGVIHRDIKSSNVLVNPRRGQVVIADFGISSALMSLSRTRVTTIMSRWYRAPEIILGTSVASTAVDVWGVGVILAELVLGEPLWPGDSEWDQFARISRTLGTPSERTWPGVSKLDRAPDYLSDDKPSWPRPIRLDAWIPAMVDAAGRDLMLGMLTMNPAQRVSARTALRSPWFDEVRGLFPPIRSVMSSWLESPRFASAVFLDEARLRSRAPRVSKNVISAHGWNLMTDWIWTVILDSLELPPETAHRAILIMDMYFMNVCHAVEPVSKRAYHLVCAVSTMLACKFECIRAFTIKDLADFMAHAYTPDEIIEAEARVANALNLRLMVPSVRYCIDLMVKKLRHFRILVPVEAVLRAFFWADTALRAQSLCAAPMPHVAEACFRIGMRDMWTPEVDRVVHLGRNTGIHEIMEALLRAARLPWRGSQDVGSSINRFHFRGQDEFDNEVRVASTIVSK